MNKRVDNLVERLDRLDRTDSQDTPDVPVHKSGVLHKISQTPVTYTLALITIVLCVLTLKWIISDPSPSTDGGYIGAGKSGVLDEDMDVEPPKLLVNHSADHYIEYKLLLHTRDRAAARDTKVLLVHASGRTRELNSGTCLIASKEKVLARTCRTEIPYGINDGSYKMRIHVRFSDSGHEVLESSFFDLTRAKPPQSVDSAAIAPRVTTMMANVTTVRPDTIFVAIAKSAANPNRINTSDSFVLTLIPKKGKTIKLDRNSCEFHRKEPTLGFFKCQASVPEGTKAGRYWMNVTLFDGVSFNEANTSTFDIE